MVNCRRARMYASENILDGARSIRPYLAELLEADAGVMDRELAGLLALAQAGQNVDNRILELLARYEATRAWMAKFLRDKRPPDVERVYNPLPGGIGPVPVSARYACPNGDYVWYRRAVNQPIGKCPTHHLPLLPVDES
jgi:hypothetical protein